MVTPKICTRIHRLMGRTYAGSSCDFVLFRIKQKNIAQKLICTAFSSLGSTFVFLGDVLVENNIYFQQFQHDNINTSASPRFSLQSLLASM